MRCLVFKVAWLQPIELFLSLALCCFACIFLLNPQKIIRARNYSCYFISGNKTHRKLVTCNFIVHEMFPLIFSFMYILTVILISILWVRSDISYLLYTWGQKDSKEWDLPNQAAHWYRWHLVSVLLMNNVLTVLMCQHFFDR